jgi:hypothetical protein
VLLDGPERQHDDDVLLAREPRDFAGGALRERLHEDVPREDTPLVVP